MQLKSAFWADLTTRDFAHIQASADVGSAVAVLPVAAIEQHGPHLPVSVDTTIVDSVIAAAVPRLPNDLPVLFLPTQQVGKSNEHQAFPGTLTLSVETLIRVWMELGDCVARAGIRKLVLFNSHGGQITVMDIVARDLRVRHGMQVFSSNWFSLPLPAEVESLFSPEEHRYGIHAGDMETSMLLATRPEYVDMAQARDFVSSAQQRARDYPLVGDGRSAKLAWQIQDYNPMGAAGNATLATADKGLRVIEAAAQQLVRMLQEVSSLPLDTLRPQHGLPL